jgi:hypothetical protein
METRAAELLPLVHDDPVLQHVVREMIYIERRLAEVKALPQIRVNPSDPSKQKATAAAKQYKELLSQYATMVRIVMKYSDADKGDDESPLRQWMRRYHDEMECR